jgi:peptide deformylase
MQVVEVHYQTSRPVVDNDCEQVMRDAREMIEMINRYDHCVALAHPQVNNQEPLRFFVTRQAIIVNPKIIRHTESCVVDKEGCMSLKEGQEFFDKSRWYKIEMEYQVVVKGKLSSVLKLDAKGFLARVFQHEIEHLDGKYCFDEFLQKEVNKNI